MLPKIKKSSAVASSFHEQTKPNAAPRTGLARAVNGLVAQLVGSGQGLEASRRIPSFTLKRIFKPVAWAKPTNAEHWLNKVVDSAIQSLPDKVLLEMSKFPQLDHALADQHGTTLPNLMSDYEHLAATHATYHLMNAVNSAMNRDWGPAARQFADSKISDMAQQLILQKLDEMLKLNQLNALVESAGLVGTVKPEGAIGQKERFALFQLTDSLVGHVLTETSLADDFTNFYALLIDESKVADDPYTRVANELANDPNPYEQMLNELGGASEDALSPPIDDSRARTDQILNGISQGLLKQSYLNLSSAVESGLTTFYQSYNQYVKNDFSPHEVSSSKVAELVRAAKNSNGQGDSAKANEWLNAERAKFKASIDQALHGLDTKTRGALISLIVGPHLQHLGKPATSLARNLPAFQAAEEHIDNDRLNTGPAASGRMGFSEKKWLLQSALTGVRNTLQKYGVADVRQAYSDNRSGYATKDTGMQRHIAQVAGAAMLEGLEPMHRKFVLNALADYGQGVTSFLKGKGLNIRSQDEGKGLSDTPQRSFSEVYSHHVQPSERKKIFTTKRDAESMVSTAALKKMVSYEDGDLGLAHFDACNNQVVMSRLYSSAGEYVAVDELGHALDFAVSKDPRRYFSPQEPSLVQEYQQNIQNQDGLTVYGQSDLLETFAESMVGFLQQHGPTSSFESWQGHNDVFSKENVQARQPVMARFADEIIKNPDKLERAVYVARKKARD